MYFEVGESHGLKLKHDEWYMRHHMAPTVAAYVTIICVKNEGMAGISVNNTKFLKTNMQEGDVLVVPAARSVFFLPQVGGDAEYIIVTLVPTAELCDLGFEVFPPSIDQEASPSRQRGGDAAKGVQDCQPDRETARRLGKVLL
ncbi:PP133 [Orf virus]|uniref:PP133 n=1 Tax=Orf virus TaxID=10258 RepID=F1AWU8_ORFV|nr:PP133 [Orf virus]